MLTHNYTMNTAFYSHPDCLLHEMGAGHPESPDRLNSINDQLIASRLIDYLVCREAPAASTEAIRRVHTQELIQFIQDHTPKPSDAVVSRSGPYYAIDADTTLNPYTWSAALRAAGAAIAATDAVIAGEVRNAFCAIRPPGHHATPSQAMGFCVFNNVAIAARHAMDVHGLERVAVVDFDVHHGNGTEAAFKKDDRVLMVSFFQHPLYPYSGVPAQNDVSTHLINIPVPAYTRGDSVRDLVTEHWLPALHAHRPELIFISAGFDAHREDEMASMNLVEDDYAWMTQQLMDVANIHAQGRIVSCLEGGYHLSALARSVIAHLRVMADLG
jgi:acetoin utilization deacetylase AcuC-like enzyme